MTGRDVASLLLGGVGVAALTIPTDWALEKFTPSVADMLIRSRMRRFGFHFSVSALVGLIAGLVGGARTGVAVGVGGMAVTGVMELVGLLMGRAGGVGVSGLGQHMPSLERDIEADIRRVTEWN